MNIAQEDYIDLKYILVILSAVIYNNMNSLELRMTGNLSSPPLLSKTWKIILVFLSLILIISLSYLFLTYVDTSGYSHMPEIQSNDRILVFAPHPDDESIGAAGLIKKALEKNATVMVVVMTDGSDAATPEEYSKYLKDKNKDINTPLVELRYNETIHAAQKLGLNESNFLFLGYPDSGLKSLFEDYWDSDKPYQSNTPFNNYDHSPYNFTYQRNVSYTGSNVADNLDDIIENFDPTIIITTDGWDEHRDHWATNAFVMYSAAETNYSGKIYTYMVHKGSQWPSPPYFEPSLNLIPPSEMQNLDVHWLCEPLSADEEKAKEDAVNSYELPISLTRGYLKSFIRNNELFGLHNRLQVEITNNTNFFTSGMPSSSFKDVRKDYATKTLKTSDYLSALGVARDGENLYIVTSSSYDIDPNLIYQYHFRFREGGEFKRLDVKVQNNTAEYQNKSINNILPGKKAEMEVKGNMAILKIPLNIFAKSSFIMMNADVNDGKQQPLDLMAWRELDIYQEPLSVL